MPRPRKDLQGMRFGQLVVLSEAGSTSYSAALWECVCDCGNKTVGSSKHLQIGGKKSCGCLLKYPKPRPPRINPNRHVLYGTRTYSVWAGMKRRCYGAYNDRYHRYGGRGIKVCNKWHSFDGFVEDMGKAPDGMTLDRIDNNGDYCLENCRWATPKQQARNTSRSRLLTYAGKTQCVSAWAEELGIGREAIKDRLRRGWSTERALTTPHIARAYLQG